MSRERPGPGAAAGPRAAPHFNEARLHEPGEASVTDTPSAPKLSDFNEARLHEPGEAPGQSAGPRSRSPDFNEARLHEPGEASARSHAGPAAVELQ